MLDDIKQSLCDCEILFHCAGHISFSRADFQQALKVNVQGTTDLLKIAYDCGVNKVVHVSAGAVLGYSKQRDEMIDETASPALKKNNVYGYTKMKAEEAVQKFVQKGLNVSIATITTVYGHGDHHLNSGSTIKALHNGSLKLIPPGGTSFVALTDLVLGLELLAERGRPGERYILCNENMEYLDLIQRIARAIDVTPPTFRLPSRTLPIAICTSYLIDLLSRARRGSVNLMTPQIIREAYGYKYYNPAKAKSELNWEPNQQFEDVVREAFAYYKKTGLIR